MILKEMLKSFSLYVCPFYMLINLVGGVPLLYLLGRAWESNFSNLWTYNGTLMVMFSIRDTAEIKLACFDRATVLTRVEIMLRPKMHIVPLAAYIKLCGMLGSECHAN